MDPHPQTFEGQLTLDDARIGIVASRFNGFLVESLIDGALDALRRHGLNALDRQVTLVRVPGSYEVPVTLQRLATSARFDALIALGVVIRGATPHFDYVAGESAKGINHVALAHALPIVNGIVTADTIEQAVERAGTKAGNKGYDAAVTAIEMTDLFRRLPGPEQP
jgi:6,7-dimethyl-8-ribityllumazine synthase